MENCKLMTPLFYDGHFNREGRRMRAVLEKEISNGTQTYRLWRSAGAPDREYPRVENDKYLLYVEANGYLAPLRITDFDLINRCGFEPAAQKLYGGEKNRGKWIDNLRESGGFDAVNGALAEERKEIELLGSDPARQAEYRAVCSGTSGQVKAAKSVSVPHSVFARGKGGPQEESALWG